MTNKLELLRRDFLNACHEDYVGLWLLLAQVRRITKEANQQRIRALAISVLTELLNQGFIKAGVPSAEGEFQEWRDGPDKVVERIEREWDQLGREPDIGDIVWFTTTEKGEAQFSEPL